MAGRALRIDPKEGGTHEQTDYTEPNATETVDETTIAALAYQLWQQRGCPNGTDHEDWFEAENTLKGQHH